MKALFTLALLSFLLSCTNPSAVRQLKEPLKPIALDHYKPLNPSQIEGSKAIDGLNGFFGKIGSFIGSGLKKNKDVIIDQKLIEGLQSKNISNGGIVLEDKLPIINLPATTIERRVVARQLLFAREGTASFYLYLLINDKFGNSEDVNAALNAYFCNFPDVNNIQKWATTKVATSFIPFYVPLDTNAKNDKSNMSALLKLGSLKEQYSLIISRALIQLVGDEALVENVMIIGSSLPLLTRFSEGLPLSNKEKDGLVVIGLSGYSKEHVENIVVSMRKSVEEFKVNTKHKSQKTLSVSLDSVSEPRVSRMVRKLPKFIYDLLAKKEPSTQFTCSS